MTNCPFSLRSSLVHELSRLSPRAVSLAQEHPLHALYHAPMVRAKGRRLFRDKKHPFQVLFRRCQKITLLYAYSSGFGAPGTAGGKDAYVEISFRSGVSIPEDVLIREVSGEAVILHLNSETYFGLDEVGTRMWQRLTSAPSIQHAYEQLLAEYDVDPETLRSHLATLIRDLVGHGLLELREA